MEKDGLLYYEWRHPGEWAANAQKLELLNSKADPGLGVGFERVRGTRYGDVLVRHILTGGPWNWAVYS